MTNSELTNHDRVMYQRGWDDANSQVLDQYRIELEGLRSVDLQERIIIADQSKEIDALRGIIEWLRDFAAEQWLKTQHSKDWYIGDATTDEWTEAYAEVDYRTEGRGDG